MTDAWTRHVRASLTELVPYDVPPADASFARLHANECAMPWPRPVMDAIAQAVAGVELGRYPDTSGRSLRAVLGQQLACDPNRVVLGNGSDEIISTLLTALSGGDGALVIPTPTFVMYRHSATVVGMPVREVPLRPDFTLDPQRMHDALDGAALCFLARPNNPTGTLWDADVIDALVAAHPSTVFVIDEAYTAYAGAGATMWRADGPANVVHMSTVSKVGGAALRLGYCVANDRLAYTLNKVRHPYNISATSLVVAELLLTRFQAEQRAMIEHGCRARDRIAQLFSTLRGATVFPSAANLVLTRLACAADAPRLRSHLADTGVLIKDVSATPALAGCVRASVGTAPELDRLEAGLRTFEPTPEVS